MAHGHRHRRGDPQSAYQPAALAGGVWTPDERGDVLDHTPDRGARHRKTSRYRSAQWRGRWTVNRRRPESEYERRETFRPLHVQARRTLEETDRRSAFR